MPRHYLKGKSVVNPWVIADVAAQLQDAGMDKFEARRLACLALVQTHHQGAYVGMANRLGMSESYVSRMLAPPDKPNRKRIGEDTLDRIRSAYGLPASWPDISTDLEIELRPDQMAVITALLKTFGAIVDDADATATRLVITTKAIR